MQSWEPASDIATRPVAVIGAGVLGRRIGQYYTTTKLCGLRWKVANSCAGCVWASGGYNVLIYDPNMDQCNQAKEYITQNVQAYAQKTNKTPGNFETTSSLAQAVENAWLVVECVPERLEAKTKIFGELTTLTRRDAILATNSSSYRSSEMLGEVPEVCKSRILNMHYYMPPNCMVVELMTDGFTDPAIIEFLAERSREVGTLPYVAKKESTGFIFNRLWAAVKRETLTILAEGVSTPEEIDSMWTEMFVKGGSLPCRTMDGKCFAHTYHWHMLTLR
jgi:3-hydroxyacyl-CoA dehydrogenase